MAAVAASVVKVAGAVASAAVLELDDAVLAALELELDSSVGRVATVGANAGVDIAGTVVGARADELELEEAEPAGAVVGAAAGAHAARPNSAKALRMIKTGRNIWTPFRLIEPNDWHNAVHT